MFFLYAEPLDSNRTQTVAQTFIYLLFIFRLMGTA